MVRMCRHDKPMPRRLMRPVEMFIRLEKDNGNGAIDKMAVWVGGGPFCGHRPSDGDSMQPCSVLACFGSRLVHPIGIQS